MPRALGGGGARGTVPLDRETHLRLHRALNEHLAGVKKVVPGENGKSVTVTMQPKKGNPGSTIQKNFSSEERTAAMRSFYDKFDAKMNRHLDAELERAKKRGGLK
jgi:hypothetical protein